MKQGIEHEGLWSIETPILIKFMAGIGFGFRGKISEENDLALRYIAELFQNLEWLHPFHDGQGRTDLFLLAKLLTENGFNPSILYFPYFSSFEPLDKWVNYLKEGIEAWKIESATYQIVKKRN